MEIGVVSAEFFLGFFQFQGSLLHFLFQTAGSALQKISLLLEGQMGHDPGFQLLGLERFTHIVYAPGREPQVFGLRIVQGGEKDNRYVLGGFHLLDMPAGLQAVHARHHDVHENQVRWVVLGLVHGFLSAIRLNDVHVVYLLKKHVQHLAIDRFIVHDQNTFTF